MSDHHDNQQAPDPLTIGELRPLKELAEHSGLAYQSLLKYAQRGRLRARRMGWIWVSTQAAVDEYLASRSLENIPKKYRKET
jgi:hypothetical protein